MEAETLSRETLLGILEGACDRLRSDAASAWSDNRCFLRRRDPLQGTRKLRRPPTDPDTCQVKRVLRLWGAALNRAVGLFPFFSANMVHLG